MDFNRKILIVLIIFIFIYIILRLVIKRIQIKQEMELEGYDNLNVNAIQDGYDCSVIIKNDLKIRLENVAKNTKLYSKEALYLRNYAIKASLNTAFNGKECSTDMINYVLTRGCRFLDFEVYLYNNNNVISTVVSISKNNDSDFLVLDNGLSISDALYYTNMYAFNSTCPNYGDPLFIQIRPKLINNADYLNNRISICDNINQAIEGNLSPRFNGKVTSETSLVDLLGKIVIVMDDTTFPDCRPNTNLSSRTIQLNKEIQDMEILSYGTLVPAQQKNLLLKEDLYTCNVNSITQIIIEDVNKVAYKININTDSLFQNYSCQVIPMIFWNTGPDLCNYETLFNKCGGGIVPLSFIYQQLKKVDNKYIEYPDPLFAFSNYGNQTTSIVILVACLGIAGFIILREIT